MSRDYLELIAASMEMKPCLTIENCEKVWKGSRRRDGGRENTENKALHCVYSLRLMWIWGSTAPQKCVCVCVCVCVCLRLCVCLGASQTLNCTHTFKRCTVGISFSLHAHKHMQININSNQSAHEQKQLNNYIFSTFPLLT